MKINNVTQKCLVVICFIVIAYGLTNGAESSKIVPIKFKSLPTYPGFDVARVDAVGKAVGFQNWPQTEVCRVGPAIDKSLLTRADLITRESISYSHVQFDQAPWCRFEWSCQRHVKTNEALPTDIPPERKARLLERMSPPKRNDPNFIEEYLKRKLDRYRRSKRYRREGSMLVQLCLAPNSRAAQEYMLVVMTESTMPTEGVVSTYVRAKRPKGLSTVSFVTESGRVKFVRDNVYVNIWANGCFASEALPLTRKIDSLIKKQPVLTYEQLLARRPSIMIEDNATKSKMTLETTVSYNISATAGQEIVDVKAYVDGQRAPVRDGKVHIIRKKGKVKLKVVATTSELLTNTFEKEVTLPE